MAARSGFAALALLAFLSLLPRPAAVEIDWAKWLRGVERKRRNLGRTRGIALPAGEILFLSDVAAELDAAARAGFATCQLLRPDDGAAPGTHAQEVDFDGVERRFAL